MPGLVGENGRERPSQKSRSSPGTIVVDFFLDISVGDRVGLRGTAEFVADSLPGFRKHSGGPPLRAHGHLDHSTGRKRHTHQSNIALGFDGRGRFVSGAEFDYLIVKSISALNSCLPARGKLH